MGDQRLTTWNVGLAEGRPGLNSPTPRAGHGSGQTKREARDVVASADAREWIVAAIGGNRICVECGAT